MYAFKHCVFPLTMIYSPVFNPHGDSAPMGAIICIFTPALVCVNAKAEMITLDMNHLNNSDFTER